MRKTELKGCPMWLLAAETEQEDVVFDLRGNLVWLGGNFLGGYFLGGDFLGGDFMGGNFYGGDFKGGDFRGGNFRGGNFRGGTFLGEVLHRTPILIQDLTWPVICTPEKLRIGCKCYTHTEWQEFSDAKISEMDPRAGAFWYRNKAFLLGICEQEARL